MPGTLRGLRQTVHGWAKCVLLPGMPWRADSRSRQEKRHKAWVEQNRDSSLLGATRNRKEGTGRAVSGARKRGCGATYCYGCLCDTCAHSVELLSWYVTIGESDEPCFNCDECRHYGGDSRMKDRWTNDCPRHIEARKAVEAREREAERREQARKLKEQQAVCATLKVIKGGK